MRAQVPTAEYEPLGATGRLERALEEYDEIVVASSFGLEDVAILDMVYDKIGTRLPVTFLDTLYHFEETLEFVDRFENEYGLDLRVYKPDTETREAFEDEHGERLWESDVERFHELTKLRQIDEALEGREAWVTGIRRQQAETRADADAVEWDDAHSLIKVNPLVDWSREEVWDYIEDNDVPYNPLHDQGYPSVGDEPLTEPVGDGDDERAGRWSDSDKTECGLHSGEGGG